MRNLKARMIKLGKNDRIALEAFEEALEAKQATSEGKSECCLHLDEWRPVFNRRHTGDNKKSKILPLPVQEVTL